MRLTHLLVSAFAGCIALTGCNTAVNQDNITTPNHEHISDLMEAQERSWNDGDLEAYMAAYWKSDSLMFIGSRGIQYGWSTTLSNYRKSYSNRELMGVLKFENQETKPLGNEAAWVAGKWYLFRTSDTLSGSYLLVWKYLNGEWKIVADHSS